MILITDSGSTKSDWAILEGNKVLKVFRAKGLNPYFVQGDELAAILKKNLEGFSIREIDSVFFYGAGCGTKANREYIANALKGVFPGAEISVLCDLMGAARALFKNRPGIACILGTGSNSCVFDGQNISERLFSAGWLFGDEGSGTHMGRTFISDYLKQRVPHNIESAFHKRTGLDREAVLKRIYRGKEPGRFLASFAPLLKENLGTQYVYKLVEGCFDSFFKEQVLRLKDSSSLPLGCVGSVAWNFREVFEKSARKAGITPEIYLPGPLERLTAYHAEKLKP